MKHTDIQAAKPARRVPKPIPKRSTSVTYTSTNMSDTKTVQVSVSSEPWAKTDR